jgi:hypothetical protein
MPQLIHKKEHTQAYGNTKINTLWDAKEGEFIRFNQPMTKNVQKKGVREVQNNVRRESKYVI